MEDLHPVAKIGGALPGGGGVQSESQSDSPASRRTLARKARLTW